MLEIILKIRINFIKKKKYFKIKTFDYIRLYIKNDCDKLFNL